MKDANVAVSLALVITMSGALPAQSPPTIRSGHPRIYVTPGDVSGIRSRCSGVYRDLYDAFKKADWIMTRTAGTDWSDVTNVAYPTFLHLVTGERRYRVKTQEFLDALTAKPPQDQYLTPEWIRAGTMALDWIWNDLSAAERARYAKTLLDMADWVLNNVWRHSDFNNHFVNEHLSVLYPAVLLAGEGIEKTRVDRLLKTGMDYLLDHAIPAANEIAGRRTEKKWPNQPAIAPYLAVPSIPGTGAHYFVGGQAEGLSYNDWGYARPLALTTEMWRVATGQDRFKDSSFFRGQSVWHAYALRPDSGTFARSEDCPSGFGPGEDLKSFLHLLATRLDDPLAEWMAGKVQWKYVQKAWREILWKNPALTPRSPNALGLPLAACFPKLGHVYFRSAWENPFSTWALFQCGPFYAGHQHVDNNTFVIHRTGSLAIDSGTNDYTSHRANYYCRTIAHNGVLVFDPNETFSGEVWSPIGTGGSNDGGQLRGHAVSRAGEFKPNSPSDTGLITYFMDSRYVAACLGDATRAYWPEKVRRALRAFVHLRAPEAEPTKNTLETFVVYDVLEMVKAKTATWVIHSLDRPEISGNRFVISAGTGKLEGIVLLPARPTIRRVGGAGKESWVNGKNYPPVQKTPDPEAGAWRIEVEIPSTALVVLYTHQKSGQTAPRFGCTTDRDRHCLEVRQGRLDYRVRLDRSLDRPPSVEVRRGGRLIARIGADVSPRKTDETLSPPDRSPAPDRGRGDTSGDRSPAPDACTRSW